jgi:PAS domain S-box-containing protein
MDKTARILVVDDDPIMLRLVSRVLREAGHEIVPAASGTEALHLAKEEAPDLIVLDVVLPDLDGIGVCRRIKENPASKDAYVILLSGQRTRSENQAVGLEAGADGYVTRPISNRELLARVEAMLRLKQAEDELKQKTEQLKSEIAERRRLERESEKRRLYLETVLRASPAAIVTVDQQQRVIDWNEAAQDLFGYSPDEATGRELTSLVTGSDKKTLQEARQFRERVMAGNPVPATKSIRYRKDGTPVDVILGGAPITIDGASVGMFVVYTDVTKRQRMERELRESRERYRNLVENQGEAVAIVTPSDRFLFANPAAHEILGVPRGELVDRELKEFLDEKNRSLVADQIERRRAGETSTYELGIARPDGERRTLLVTASPRPSDDGQFKGTLAVFRDISERKELERTLEWEAEANSVIAGLMRALLGSATIADISDLVLRGARYLTDSAFGYVGVIESETGHLVCPTMTREIWDLCQVENKSAVFEHFGGLWGWVLENQESLMTNEPSNDPRSSGTPDGHIPVRRLLAAPAMIDGRLVGQVALANADRNYTGRDLTLVERLADIHALAIQHLQAEEQLRQHRENLEEMVEQRTRELREAQEKLLRNEKLAMLGQLAGSINHELRGPLGNIKSGAYFLDMALEEPDDDVDETLTLLQHEVDRAESIVSSLLNFVRTREPQREPVNVNHLIDDILSHTEMPETIDVLRNTDEDFPIALGDSDQLRQAFRNLITNAVEAMPEGGQLTIQISRSHRDLATPGGQVIVSVSDTGEGIPEGIRERIFEPLFSTKSDGVGLGLALAHMLVEAHDGTIDLESEKDQGATFTVRLPLADGEDKDP